MSNTNNTRVRWIADEGDYIADGQNTVICQGFFLYGPPTDLSNTGYERHPNWQKNKHLIAAAPEMLEALEYLFEKMDDADSSRVRNTGKHLYPYSKFKEIDNIIKKAKGE